MYLFGVNLFEISGIRLALTFSIAEALLFYRNLKIKRVKK
jgi:hypothetical protein